LSTICVDKQQRTTVTDEVGDVLRRRRRRLRLDEEQDEICLPQVLGRREGGDRDRQGIVRMVGVTLHQTDPFFSQGPKGVAVDVDQGNIVAASSEKGAEQSADGAAADDDDTHGILLSLKACCLKIAVLLPIVVLPGG
jgi:hypothetical protein